MPSNSPYHRQTGHRGLLDRSLPYFGPFPPKGPKSYGRARVRVPLPPPPLCALLTAARLQSNQRLCPLLRRDFQRWLHWRVTDAEMPGVLRSSSRPPLTLVKRQRGDTEATCRGGSSGGTRGAGAEATSQGGSSGGSEMALAGQPPP